MQPMTETTRRLANPRPVHREAWLLGQPPLSNYLTFVRKSVAGGEALRQSALIDEWRAANDLYYDLNQSEAGIADAIETRDIAPALQPLCDAVVASPIYRRAFDTLPTRFAMVELDRLVVSQPHVDLDHADRLKASLGRRPTPQSLFKVCIPIDSPAPAVRIERAGAKRFLFTSDSSDIRFHEAVTLTHDRLHDYVGFGPVAGIIGLVVGFGSNFLSAIQSDTRLLLHNGHHRAYALRALGITHAPCLVQTVTRLDELAIAASEDVVERAAFYFKSPRPPLFKDFFDSRIAKVLAVNRIVRAIEVNFDVRDFEMQDALNDTANREV